MQPVLLEMPLREVDGISHLMQLLISRLSWEIGYHMAPPHGSVWSLWVVLELVDKYRHCLLDMCTISESSIIHDFDRRASVLVLAHLVL